MSATRRLCMGVRVDRKRLPARKAKDTARRQARALKERMVPA